MKFSGIHNFYLCALILCACSASVSPTDQDCGSCSLKNSEATRVSSSYNAFVSSSSVVSSLNLQLDPIEDGAWIRGVSTIELRKFKIANTEITQADYKIIMDSIPPQKIYGDSFPVANVTWYEAVLFCNALSKNFNLDTAYSYSSVSFGNVLVDVSIDYNANAIRLPTEAEWEYAARAGSSSIYYWGTKTASNYAQYALTSGYRKIAEKIPNAWNLYDMSGNVSEWCSDWYAAYSSEAILINPTGPSKGIKKVFRGGSWNSTISSLSSSERNSALPDESENTRGFRVVLSGDI